VFNAGKVDFYTATATAMLGPPPEDKQERNRWRDHCKQTILGIVNGMGPSGLAKRLGCDKATAKFYLDKFEAAYPNDMAYRRLIVEQVALVGRVVTFAGRDRTDTAHRWLVTLPRVRILVSFRGPPANRYWLDVSPLEPHRHTLTCYIHRAWDAAPGAYTGALIYDAEQGCTTQRVYHLYDTTFLQFRLPLRNFGWRSIRRVRPGQGSANWGEEVKYRGLDAATRALFNALAQGGTADLTKLMILSVGPTLARFNAKLLLQIHDELLFEVPQEQVQSFVDAVVPELTQVVPEFAVPVILEAKIGARFGEMEPLITANK
jgi:DNA polymerase I-like protein with 3'-5' exonuclease and polymerase domains